MLQVCKEKIRVLDEGQPSDMKVASLIIILVILVR
jgi:hypothetical protein